MKKIKKSMNKNCKLFIIVLTIILSIIVSGCTPIDGGGTQFTMKDLRKGNKGLEIKFIKDAPPNVVFENDPNILIALSVENLGASDIKNGVISIGVEEDYMSINEINFNNEDKTDLIVFDLEGKSIDNPIGGYAPLEIYTTSKDISLSRLQDTSARIFSCYDYQTILEESICLDPVEIRKDMSSKACVGGNFAPGTQGAPVNVKKVDVLSKRGKKVLGIDPNEKLIELAKQEAPELNIKKGSAEDIDEIVKGKVDSILMIDVLEFIEKDSEILKKVNNHLNDNGQLVLVVPAYEFLYGKRDKKQELLIYGITPQNQNYNNGHSNCFVFYYL